MPSAYTTLYNFYFNNSGLHCSFFPSLRHNWDEFQSQTQNHSWWFTAVFCVWYIQQCTAASPIIQDCLWGGAKLEEFFFYSRNQGNGDSSQTPEFSADSQGYLSSSCFSRQAWATPLRGWGSPPLLYFCRDLSPVLSMHAEAWPQNPAPQKPLWSKPCEPKELPAASHTSLSLGFDLLFLQV